MNSLVSLDADGGDGGDITMGADQWRTVAAVGGGGTVAEVVNRLSAGEFAACKAVKALVDLGLAIVTARALETPAAVSPAAPKSRPASAEPAAAPAPDQGGSPAVDTQTASRSELVRQLSQLRGGN